MRTSESTLTAGLDAAFLATRLGAALVALAFVWACTGSTSGDVDEDAPCESEFDCPIAFACAPSGTCVLLDADVDPLPDAGPGHDAGDVDLDVELSPLHAWGIAALSTGPAPGRNNAHGWCVTSNLIADDLAEGWYDDFWPREGFGRTVVDDEAARCGDDFETLAWRLANCERMSRNLEPLACDVRAVWLGRLHSDDMVQRGYFDHMNRQGQSPFDRMTANGVTYRAAGENIANYPDVESAHIGWMNSDGHRENILSPSFTHSGLGVIRGARNIMLTAMFLTPR